MNFNELSATAAQYARKLPPAGRSLQAFLIRVYLFLKNVNYTGRSFLVVSGLAVVLIIGVYVGHRLLNPFKPVEADYKPFESVAEYEAFIEANPLLITKVPAERNFIMSGIIREDKKAVYTIELQSRPIKPEMSETYIQSYLAMLDESQKDALDWIRSQGQNPDNMEIVWRPDPEDRRGRLLGESSKKNPQKGYDGSTAPTPTATATPSPSPTPSPTPSAVPDGDTVAPPPGRFPL